MRYLHESHEVKDKCGVVRGVQQKAYVHGKRKVDMSSEFKIQILD